VTGAGTNIGTTTEFLVHNKVRLALHHLRGGAGRTLLLLHGLAETSPTSTPSWSDGWPGPIAALDFTGHGASSVPAGGGYSAEIMLADADIALAAVGEATLVGRGLGAYVALMLAGARPLQVRGAVLCDGVGLTGGATGPTSGSFVRLPPSSEAPDPYAMFELSRDLRPPDYATHFVRLALDGSGLDEPIAVAAIVRPKWLQAVVEEVGVVTCSLPDALMLYS
jgi:pimeloyl-ACP methyl ester carboxylesterase